VIAAAKRLADLVVDKMLFRRYARLIADSSATVQLAKIVAVCLRDINAATGEEKLVAVGEPRDLWPELFRHRAGGACCVLRLCCIVCAGWARAALFW
jgi:hypothetical protein